VAAWPAVRHFGSAFIANGAAGYGEAGAGDHLQTVYRFWLVGHQLEQGEAPWVDPYSFQPFVEPQTVLGAWPFGLPFWPLEALLGPVVAWNVLLLGTIVAAGLLTYWWLRALGVGGAAAFVGGIAFALAPYRLAQSSVHLIGWIAVLLPLTLLAIERARAAESRRAAHAWGAVAALALLSVPLSGQVHLALGAVPFVLAYALVRFGRVSLAWAAGGAAAAVGLGLVIRYTLIAGSAEEGGRSLQEAIRAVLPELGMAGGNFEIVLSPLEQVGSEGREEVEFRVSLNRGFEPRPLAQVASGGELSRVMLAIKTVLARVDSVATLIFDEVDAGIGGRVALQVGEKMRSVAETHQVFAITHLPQIASRAHTHLQVQKREGDGRVATEVRPLEGDARVHEIARMLGGDPESRVSLDHARELLDRGSLLLDGVTSV
jgi:hypothetical protein